MGFKIKNTKTGEIFETELHSEEHCEECHEIIHNSFDCPVCNIKYVSTDMYGNQDLFNDFICENCKTRFIVLGYC